MSKQKSDDDPLRKKADLVINYPLPRSLSKRFTREDLADASELIREFPRRELDLPFPESSPPETLEQDEVDAYVNYRFSFQLLLKRPKDWFVDIVDKSWELFDVLKTRREHNECQILSDLIEVAGYPPLSKTKPVEQSLRPVKPRGPDETYFFEEPGFSEAQFGARLFLWLAIAKDPDRFEYPTRFRRDLEYATTWVQTEKATDGTEVWSTSERPMYALRHVIDRVVITDDYDTTRAQTNVPSDGIKEDGRFCFDGKCVRLSRGNADILSLVWVSTHRRSTDEAAFFELRSDSRSGKPLHAWLADRIGKINKDLEALDFALSQNVVDGEVTLVRKSTGKPFGSMLFWPAVEKLIHSL